MATLGCFVSKEPVKVNINGFKMKGHIFFIVCSVSEPPVPCYNCRTHGAFFDPLQTHEIQMRSILFFFSFLFFTVRSEAPPTHPLPPSFVSTCVIISFFFTVHPQMLGLILIFFFFFSYNEFVSKHPRQFGGKKAFQFLF